jgi:hypothetical protein
MITAWDFNEYEPDSDSGNSNSDFKLRVDTGSDNLNDEADMDEKGKTTKMTKRYGEQLPIS